MSKQGKSSLNKHSSLILDMITKGYRFLDIHRELNEKGIKCAYQTVRNYINERPAFKNAYEDSRSRQGERDIRDVMTHIPSTILDEKMKMLGTDDRFIEALVSKYGTPDDDISNKINNIYHISYVSHQIMARALAVIQNPRASITHIRLAQKTYNEQVLFQQAIVNSELTENELSVMFDVNSDSNTDNITDFIDRVRDFNRNFKRETSSQRDLFFDVEKN